MAAPLDFHWSARCAIHARGKRQVERHRFNPPQQLPGTNTGWWRDPVLMRSDGKRARPQSLCSRDACIGVYFAQWRLLARPAMGCHFWERRMRAQRAPSSPRGGWLEDPPCPDHSMLFPHLLPGSFLSQEPVFAHCEWLVNRADRQLLMVSL